MGKYKAWLRVCVSCKWIFKSEKKHPICPKCKFGAYGAYSVYGRVCYKYAETQEPWKKIMMNRYEKKLNAEINNWYFFEFIFDPSKYISKKTIT